MLLQPWLQCTAGEPAPFTTRKLASAKILGPVLLSQAVLKKVRWEGLEALAKPSRPTELHLESGPGPASCAGGRGWEMPSQPHSSLFLARPSTSNRTGQEGGSHNTGSLSFGDHAKGQEAHMARPTSPQSCLSLGRAEKEDSFPVQKDSSSLDLRTLPLELMDANGCHERTDLSESSSPVGRSRRIIQSSDKLSLRTAAMHWCLQASPYREPATDVS